MIKQTATGLDSRSLANPYNENGFLPLIVSPMYSCVDETNYQIFLDNKIQVCLPRKKHLLREEGVFESMSLEDFRNTFIDCDTTNSCFKVTDEFGNGTWVKCYICVDCANGNMPLLHNAIREAKEIHGDNIIIMAGNVSSVEAFVELAKTGVDFIRTGIGGGGGCNTTSNTGVGQEDLEELIQVIKRETKRFDKILKTETGIEPFSYIFYDANNSIFYNTLNYQEMVNLCNVKIVADGISTYIKQCESKYGFNDNGYAAINKLLFAGSSMVMIGKLFAQCVESAGQKRIRYDLDTLEDLCSNTSALKIMKGNYSSVNVEVKYSGMSTTSEQKNYKTQSYKELEYDSMGLFYPSYKVAVTEETKNNGYESDIENIKVLELNKPYEIEWIDIGQSSSTIKLKGFKDFFNSVNFMQVVESIKPSEGSVNWIPVRFLLSDWLHGNDTQDTYPYLMGWVNSIKSAMSYCNKFNL